MMKSASPVYPLPDPFSETLADDPYLRLAVATATFVYDCHVNLLCGVECTLHVGDTTDVRFPAVIRNWFGGDDQGSSCQGR